MIQHLKSTHHFWKLREGPSREAISLTALQCHLSYETFRTCYHLQINCIELASFLLMISKQEEAPSLGYWCSPELGTSPLGSLLKSSRAANYSMPQLIIHIKLKQHLPWTLMEQTWMSEWQYTGQLSHWTSNNSMSNAQLSPKQHEILETTGQLVSPNGILLLLLCKASLGCGACLLSSSPSQSEESMLRLVQMKST